MFCRNCGNEIADEAVVCVTCGVPTRTVTENEKQRLIYILLALFIGALGIHNFYAGRNSAGMGQLILTLLIVGTPIAMFWAVMDIIFVSKDGNGDPMK